jgi:hypothetical protein
VAKRLSDVPRALFCQRAGADRTDGLDGGTGQAQRDDLASAAETTAPGRAGGLRPWLADITRCPATYGEIAA